MRYALRNQAKIAAKLGDEYLRGHIAASLDSFFATATEQTLTEATETVSVPSEDGATEFERQYLRINDVADPDAMQEFVIIGSQWDVIRLAYSGRIKG